MQLSETVCLWNYRFNTNKPTNFICKERSKCENELTPKAIVYCVQCNSLQCHSCEYDIHKNLNNQYHIRLDLNAINNECCSINRQHPAIFFCSTCQLSFCYDCYQNQHTDSSQREHKLEKSRQGQQPSMQANSDEPETKTESNNIDLSSNVNTSSLLPVLNGLPEQSKIDEKPLVESIVNDNQIKNLSKQDQTTIDRQKGFLLIDTKERLVIKDESEFLHHLKCEQETNVQCVSIIGYSGDGKSYILNQIFFNGQEVFPTSSTADPCTKGIWAALDDDHRILVVDTEGRLGLSDNDNRRDRLLMKVLCMSDIVIYHTRASRLPDDMFEFLSNGSNVFNRYFRNELEKDNVINRSMGPVVIVYHETQYTDILKDDSSCPKTAVEQLKDRFETMNVSFDAFSSIEYVGIQSQQRNSSNFNEIKINISTQLNNRRSSRSLSSIFRTLKIFNEKFNTSIHTAIPSTLPDDIFACSIKCLSCGAKCARTANHERDNIRHVCDKHCYYSKELDNEVWKCLKCHHEGRETIVYGKLVTKNDGLVQGLLKYVWSGCVIECPHHGEIYRSRKYWYGNNEPKDVTYIDIVHVWPDDDNSRLASDVTPRKFVELIVYASSYLSTPTKILSEMVADQMAPSYWVPNKYVLDCSGCKLHFGSEYSKHHCRICGHVFCDTCTRYRRVVRWIDAQTPVRVCLSCYNNPEAQLSVEIPKDILDQINENSSSDESISTISSSEQVNDLCLTASDLFEIESTGSATMDIPTSRRVYESVKSGLEKIGVNYPIELIKQTTQPTYWKPDNECYACHVCKQMFNSTTNRLHHCRSCGEGVCEHCSPNKRPVPERDWLTPVRVCKLCD